jgi:hypothetical protein
MNAKGIPFVLCEGAFLLGYTIDGTAKNPLYALRNNCFCSVKNGIGEMINPSAIRDWLKKQGKVEPIDEKRLEIVLKNVDIMKEMVTGVFNSLIVKYPLGKVDKEKISKAALRVIVEMLCTSDMPEKEKQDMIQISWLNFKLYLDWLSEDSYVVRKAC